LPLRPAGDEPPIADKSYRSFEIALVPVRLNHIASVIVKHSQLLVAPRNETENVMKNKTVTLSRRFVLFAPNVA